MGQYYVPRPVVHVTYSHDGPTLLERITKACKDYERQDPITWPLADIMDNADLENSANQLPTGVAYELVDMENFLKDQKKNRTKNFPTRAATTKHATLKGSKINSRFLAYPFNFDKDGVERIQLGIPKPEYKLYMTFMEPVGPKKAERKHVTSSADSIADTTTGARLNKAPAKKKVSKVKRRKIAFFQTFPHALLRHFVGFS